MDSPKMQLLKNQRQKEKQNSRVRLFFEQDRRLMLSP